uniref:Uncharacterized protein n=1 Tax=Plectus sambesii TaxID=2011161 RepID=A0A914X6B0_9BILA
IQQEDQVAATEEKTVLEQAQRERAKQIKASNDVHRPNAFDLDTSTEVYQYKHADFRPWDPHNDLRQVECDYVIRSVAKHKTPLIRSNSAGSEYQAADEVDAVSDDSSDAAARKKRKRRSRLSPQPVGVSKAMLDEALKPLQNAVERAEQQLTHLQQRLDSANKGQAKNGSAPFHGLFEQLGVAIVFAVVQAILLAYLLRR